MAWGKELVVFINLQDGSDSLQNCLLVFSVWQSSQREQDWNIVKGWTPPLVQQIQLFSHGKFQCADTCCVTIAAMHNVKCVGETRSLRKSKNQKIISHHSWLASSPLPSRMICAFYLLVLCVCTDCFNHDSHASLEKSCLLYQDSSAHGHGLQISPTHPKMIIFLLNKLFSCQTQS